MARILAIDYGGKRCGIAITDESKIIASGLTTVDTKDLLSWLKDYVPNEKVELFIVGEPKRLHGEASESEKLIQPFLLKLADVFPDIPVKRIDERFTSKIAFNTMLASGISKKKRRNKALVDQISATIILQDYLYNQ
ncbi:Holliday junction resolvase RuvX [Aquimarina muelleri]|uniref:Putative pre-16S rRNA nuclease n=1 Tax=Aquimarina muelleri TaxID=279356 RepID=A0A918N279_9FLAO|nr:Holliday junction resolvase RuvX [Aquimarina muelleri]MCX2761263.1 Holliday junction resolvase RuvX [Aquimarina muelleri]GGX09476.1 putative pre-16S rRNA nuclease [Aquimarina muelleri]